ncbi:MAG: hypothetical protein U9Q76_02005 [candidate division WOR-3 bacterium]|nr:hypothetical protein [candidate division WOR-3 bacterium]
MLLLLFGSKDRIDNNGGVALKIGLYELCDIITRVNMPSHADARVIREHSIEAEVLHLTEGRVCVELVIKPKLEDR